MSVYTENGYRNRAEYLAELAEETGIDPETVYAAADILGPDEDFDGLISILDDYCYY